MSSRLLHACLNAVIWFEKDENYRGALPSEGGDFSF
jgi:hypothetical protein